MSFFTSEIKGGDVPDREDTTSLSDVGLFLNTTDSLLEKGGDLSRRSLGLSSVVTDLLGGTSDGTGDNRASLDHAEFVNVRITGTEGKALKRKKGIH